MKTVLGQGRERNRAPIGPQAAQLRMFFQTNEKHQTLVIGTRMPLKIK